MNDNLIFGCQTKEQHHTIIARVLYIFWRHQLYLIANKCMFRQPMVEYLSLILSEGRVEMDPIKVAGICDWLTWMSVTKVQLFVGFVNFYQLFIQDFSHEAKPLHQLTKKGDTWRWTEAKQEAFKDLKWLITLSPILMQPDQDAQFQPRNRHFRICHGGSIISTV